MLFSCPQCGRALMRKPLLLTPKTCPGCGAAFVPTTLRQKFHDTACKDRFYNRRGRKLQKIGLRAI